MGCSCQQSSFEPFSGSGNSGVYDPQPYPTSIGEDPGGNAERQDCYMQRAGDPQQSSAGTKIDKEDNNINSNIIIPVQEIFIDDGSGKTRGFDQVSSLIVDDNNRLNIEFILNNPTKTIGKWGYKWVSYTTEKKPAISAKAVNDNYSLVIDSILPKGNFVIQISAYEGNYSGDDYIIKEDEPNDKPIINKQTYTINVESKKDIPPIVMNMPVLGKPKLLARYGITFGLKDEDGESYDRSHTGVDFGGDLKVVAASDGIVVDTSESHSIYGDYILMRHNGFKKTESVYVYSLYATLGSINIKSSNKIISTGSIIGETGISGLPEDSEEDQIHFEIRRSPQLVTCLNDMTDFEWIDPLSVINGEFSVEDTNIILDNSNKSNALSSTEGSTIMSNNCNPASVQYDPANYEDVKVDPKNTISGSVTEKLFVCCMEGEIVEGYGQKYHNSEPTIKGCPGGNPPLPRGISSKGRPCGWHVTPGDKGGETKYGVSRNNNTKVNMTSLNRDQAIQIFVQKYAKACKFDQIKSDLFKCCYTCQYYQGPKLTNLSARYIIHMGGFKINYYNSEGLSANEIEQLNRAVDKLGSKNAFNIFMQRFGDIWSSRVGYVTRRRVITNACFANFKE